MKTWLMKMTGAYARAEQDLENHRRTLASIEQRQTESTAALERQIDSRRHEIEERQLAERAALPRDMEPQRLDPLARSIEQQQAAQSAEYLGAAAPADTTPATSASDASPASDAGYDGGGAGFMDDGNREHDGPGIGHGDG
jgi:TolA-binding protein